MVKMLYIYIYIFKNYLKKFYFWNNIKFHKVFNVFANYLLFDKLFYHDYLMKLSWNYHLIFIKIIGWWLMLNI